MVLTTLEPIDLFIMNMVHDEEVTDFSQTICNWL